MKRSTLNASNPYVKILLDDRDVPLKGILQHYEECQEECYKYMYLQFREPDDDELTKEENE